MSKSAHAKDAVLELLEKIQGSLADLRSGQVDMRRDIRDLKSSNARILGMIGDMLKSTRASTIALTHLRSGTP